MATTYKQAHIIEVEDCGIDHAQHFPGAGAYGCDDVFVGCGDNPSEAMEDALEQAADCDWDADAIERDPEVAKALAAHEPSAMEETTEELRGMIAGALSKALRDCASDDAIETAVDAALESLIDNGDVLDTETSYYVVLRVSEKAVED